MRRSASGDNFIQFITLTPISLRSTLKYNLELSYRSLCCRLTSYISASLTGIIVGYIQSSRFICNFSDDDDDGYYYYYYRKEAFRET